ncbi:MAG: hypothetical protein AMXMBFR83_10080 [Phycisphaerae bacterium]
MRRHHRKELSLALGFALVSSLAVRGQTVLFSDNFDSPTPGGEYCGRVSGWPVLPGKVNGYSLTGLFPSPCGHQKNHTGSPLQGGSAFEPDGNPGAFASYRSFDPQTGIVRLSVWVWDDVESRKDHTPSSPFGWWPSGAPIRGMVGLTSNPGEPTSSTQTREIYPYADYAFIGVEALVPNGFPAKPNPNLPGFNPYDPAHVDQYVYRWWTSADGWNLTQDPTTGQPVPRRVDFRYAANGAELTPQTWRHVEIEVYPYSGRVGDVRFYIDGKLVGQGRRQPGPANAGVAFARIQLGTRFPTEQDIAPTYSYEHFWFDDLTLSTAPAPPPCPNEQVRFDADGDGDVDQLDFAAFQLCFTGANPLPGAYNWAECRCMNSDPDADIDENDLERFKDCVSAPMVTAIGACDDGLPPP